MSDPKSDDGAAAAGDQTRTSGPSGGRPSSGRSGRTSRPSSSKRKSKKGPPINPDACPEPKAAICDDPEARPPRPPPPRKSSAFIEFIRRITGRRRKIHKICDCKSKTRIGDTLTELYDEDDEIYEMASLHMQELLRKKRDGGELTEDDLYWFAENVAKDRIEECQIGAMLMAMCIVGLSQKETRDLTQGIINSGEVLTWDESWGGAVDKHSTGGVGDKVSLVLAPALASFGLKVPMLSGRGLGHTGGTLDKLESIPGFRVECSLDTLKNALEVAGCFIAGASENIAPADRILYGIRDVTATTDNIPLVVSSIVSKKVASGAKHLVMDIKVGHAAFFKTIEDARTLANEIIRVSREFGVTTRAIISKMENPVGKGIGNSLEVEDAVECMRGNGTHDLVELVAIAGGLILQEKNLVSSLDEGKASIINSLNDGKALKCFQDMITCQGVDPELAETLCKGYTSKVLRHVPQSQITPMRVASKGTITKIDALELGTAVWRLGAGRVNPDQVIDYRVGIWLTHVVGDQVAVGDVWAEVHHNSPELHPDIQKQIEEAITIEPGKLPVEKSLIIEII
ncbi:hypothetical protein R5R35_011405 [Gryllus longicercus]|uniref:Pyrimidine nucleoside phosphorylase C-terminal domain-containing protein n=1 Tax=Gryllus longicercus TaxID=2509291 RepID=A0AAN9YZB4_9ORTH